MNCPLWSRNAAAQVLSALSPAAELHGSSLSSMLLTGHTPHVYASECTCASATQAPRKHGLRLNRRSSCSFSFYFLVPQRHDDDEEEEEDDDDAWWW